MCGVRPGAGLGEVALRVTQDLARAGKREHTHDQRNGNVRPPALRREDAGRCRDNGDVTNNICTRSSLATWPFY